MFNKIIELSDTFSEKAKQAKESIDCTIKETSDSMGCTIKEASDSLSSSKEESMRAFEQHWPAIEKIATEGLIGIAEEKLSDKIFLESTLGRSYELLPIAVRLVIGREKFIAYCMSHHKPISTQLESFKLEYNEKHESLKIEKDENS